MAIALDDYFLGRWRIERNFSQGEQFLGLANFEENSDGTVRYRENGTLILATGLSLSAFRTYRYRIRHAKLAILFDEDPPRIFQTIEITRKNEWSTYSIHLCGDDEYKTRYRLLGDEEFRVENVVTGPRKGYISLGKYKRNNS